MDGGVPMKINLKIFYLLSFLSGIGYIITVLSLYDCRLLQNNKKSTE